MYCENCGTEIKEDYQWCKECGNKLTNDSNDYTSMQMLNVKSKKAKSLRKFSIIALLSVFVIIGGKLIFFHFNSNKSDTLIIQQYFKELCSQNWEKAYDYLSVPDTDFTSKEMFISIMGNTNKAARKIEEMNVIYSKNTEDYIINYKIKDKKDAEQYYVKMGENGKIIDANIMAEHFIISIPPIANLSIDGILLGREFILNKNDSRIHTYEPDSDTYYIPNLFIGKHIQKITTPFTKDYTENFKLEGSLETFNDGDELEVSNNFQEDFDKKSKKIIKLIYSAALSNKSFDEIKDNFTCEKKDLDKIKDSYDQLLWIVKGNNDDTGLVQISFSKFKRNDYSINFYSSVYDCSMKFNFKITAVMRYYDSIETYKHVSEKPKEGQMRLRFVNENGKWVVKSIYIDIYDAGENFSFVNDCFGDD